MLLAILYTDDGFLAAAAPACDQQPEGDRFWNQFASDLIREGQSSETAHLHIADEALVERLLTMDFADGHAAAHAVDNYLFP